MVTTPGAKFLLGRTLMTQGVATLCAEEQSFQEFVASSIARHIKGDWGDMCQEDKEANDEAVTTGGRLMSAYEQSPTRKVWVITEWDRSATTVLFPDEY